MNKLCFLKSFNVFFLRSASEHVKSRKILLSDDLDGMKEVRAKKEKLQEQYHSTLEVLQARRTALESELNHVSYGLLWLYPRLVGWMFK